MDELALIRDTITRYAPVLIASLSTPIRRTGGQKNLGRAGSQSVTVAPLTFFNLLSPPSSPAQVGRYGGVRREAAAMGGVRLITPY
jgi:hypothetical protein